jgi:hypothetical protein
MAESGKSSVAEQGEGNSSSPASSMRRVAAIDPKP